MFGSLPHYNEEMEGQNIRKSRIPSIFIYIFTYLLVLSKVDHKELRFYAPVA